MIRFAKLKLPFNIEKMQTELSLFKDGWKAHFNKYYYEGSWAGLALRSPGGQSKNIIPELITDAVYMDTELMPSFPSVMELVSTLKCPIKSVRFLNLQAGAIIKPHRDNELAFEKGEARLHFTVITNPDVKFYIEDDKVPFKEGDCWYMNANLMHRVSNEGSTDRIHLIIDCEVNNWLSEMITLSDEVSSKEDDPEYDISTIIYELRRKNEKGTNRLADELEKQLNDAKTNNA
ncbi:MAG: Aspartyl/Asparaginyl beta-hydroxylase [Mucilaginibacter sp.]|nr:Aspartyl/Asparaginyl beta-hydroxylase [Mucilaginibacter sp.]